MAQDIAELGIRIVTDGIRRGRQALDDLTRAGSRAEGATDSLSRTVMSLGKGLGALAGIVTAIDFGSKVIQAQRDFDKLNASLITATGSVGNASQAFAALQRFAASTPYDLQQVSKAFIQLRNLGLEPSERALMSYGNTAAAMGKDLSQLVEAVADAATGEFERLKEFGIKAKQQGDQVALTFQGTTTTVANNSRAIEEYLIKLGEVKFAGGMELQAKTLDGALSGLADTWDMTLLAFAQSGFGDATYSAVLGLTGALTDLQAIIKAVSGEADAQKKSIEELGPVHKGLTTIFETVAVLGANVAYVFTAIGKDIGAFAAAVMAAAQGDFKMVLQIATMRKQDAERERKEIDARTEAILGAAVKARTVREQEQQEKAAAGRDDLARYAIERKEVAQQTEGQKKAAKERAKAAQDALQWYQQTTQAGADEIAMLRMELDAVGELTPAQREAIKVRAEMARLGNLIAPKQRELVEGQLAEKEALEQVAAERENYLALMQASASASASDVAAAEARVEELKKQVEHYGLAETAVLELTLAELRRQQVLAGDDAFEQDRLFRLIAATEDQLELQTKLSKMKAGTEFWDSLESTAHQTFVSIADGGKNAAQRLKDTFKNIFFDWLYQQTLKKWIINLQGTVSADTSGLSSIASLISGGASGGAGGGGDSILGSASSLLSIGKTIYSGFTGGLMSSLGSTITSMGTTFGSAAIAEFGAGMSGVAGTNLAAGTAASAGATSASVIPVIGWIIAGMMQANGLYKQGFDTHNGTVEDPIGLGSGIRLFDNVLRGIGLSDKTANIFSGQATFAKLFGRANPVMTSEGLRGSFDGGGAHAQNYANVFEKGGIFRSDKSYQVANPADAAFVKGLTDAYDQMKAASGALAASMGVSTAKLGDFLGTFDIVFDKDASKREQQIADMMAKLGNDLATYLVPNIATFAAEGETASATLQRLATEFANTNAIMQTIGVDGAKAFGAVGLASIEARERLLTLAGGVDALASQTQFFAQNFLTEAERMAPVQKAVNDQLAALGYAGVTTADQFRGAVMDLVNGGGLATEQGAKTYASLLALAPAFKTVTDYVASLQTAADAVVTVDPAVALKKRELEIQLMELTGDAAGALAAQRADELAAADASLRPIMQMIYARQDEAAAAEKSAAALEKNEQALLGFVDNAMDAVSRAVAAEKKWVQTAYEEQLAALQVRIDGVTASIAKLSGLSGVLKNGLNSMTMAGTESGTRAAAQAQIEAALVIARAGGALPTADSIRDAVALASKSNTDDFGSFLEYQRDFVRTSSALSELSGLTDDQLTEAEKQLKALNDEKALLQDWYTQEIERLDLVLEKAQQQVDALNGINTSVLSVAQAVGMLAASIAGVKAGATPSNPTGGGLTMEQLYQSVLGRAPDAAGAAYWQAIFGDSIDEDDIRNFVNGAAGELGGRVPGFANGGNHAGGWRVVGERGPELEATGPARIHSNAASTALMAGVEARLESLENTIAVGLLRVVDETKRGADAVEDINDKGVYARDEMEVN